MDDLSHAYRFRLNCERSEAILQSFVDSSIDSADDIDSNEKNFDENEASSVVVASDEGAFYEYWPPIGLNVKRVRSDSNKSLGNVQLKELKNLQSNKADNKSDHMELFRVERIDENLSEEDVETDANDSVDNDRKQPLRLNNKKFTADVDADDPDYNPSQENDTKIKHVRVNKARLGFPAANKKTGNSSEKPAKRKDNGSPNNKRASGEKKQPKTCPICGNTYKFQHALESHMRRHRNEKPFVCSVCGKGFVINFELTRHMRTVSIDLNLVFINIFSIMCRKIFFSILARNHTHVNFVIDVFPILVVESSMNVLTLVNDHMLARYAVKHSHIPMFYPVTCLFILAKRNISKLIFEMNFEQ